VFTLRQLLDAVLIQSANDASVAIAEHLGGTPEGFVEMMNVEARALGMSDSVFRFPHGLPPATGQEPDLVSARDFTKLSRALITKFPQVLEVTSKSEAPFRDGSFIMRNHNHLIRSYPGADGLKTGYYTEAGFSVAATAARKGVRLVTVVMGCDNRKARDELAASLLSRGFAQYRLVKAVEKGTPVGSARVAGGEKGQVPLIAANDVSITMRVTDESRLTKRQDLCPGLNAPVKVDAICGKITVLIGDKEVGSTPVLATEAVNKRTGFLSSVVSYFDSWR
jgi:serine-type D-Ala-D-Ala carboxypeptidase (penicillin-binding protein 5/6)